MAGARSGTKAQKSRSEVRGGGAKPWRQKGTGRARAGTSRSPIWRSGGVTFAAKTRDYSKKLNKKMRRAAMCSIFSELVRQGRFIIVEDFELDSHKTSEFVKFISDVEAKSILIISDTINEKLYLASRNLYNIEICDVDFIDPVSLIGFEKTIITKSALRLLEEVYAK